VRLAVRKNDYVARLQFYRRMRLIEDEAFALGQDVKQHHTFRMRQNDGGKKVGIGRIQRPGEENSAVKNTAPDKRTIRKTSDSMSMECPRPSEGMQDASFDQELPSLGQVSSDPGVLSKRNGVPGMDGPANFSDTQLQAAVTARSKP
jgi:hypothetical protein